MSKNKKSIKNDFLTFIGIMPIEKPIKRSQKLKRKGYQIEFLDYQNESERKSIKEDADKMKELFCN